MSDLSSALLVDGQKNEHEDGWNLDVLQNVSLNVRKRVEVLREIQGEHGELEAKYFDEMAALENKYQILYKPLYNKRHEIVNDIVEVEEVNTEAANQKEDNAAGEKGVPDFWLNAIKNNNIVAEEELSNISKISDGAK